jgi:hypothetical protein
LDISVFDSRLTIGVVHQPSGSLSVIVRRACSSGHVIVTSAITLPPLNEKLTAKRTATAANLRILLSSVE